MMLSSGQLARIAPAAEAGTRSIGVTVALPNAQERLRAGQYAVGRVVLADPRERLLLPATAVGTGGGQTHVWVIEGGRLARRAVVLGRRDETGARVEVVEGLGADARVLGTRFDNLREGALARIGGSAAGPAGTAPAVASAASSATLR